MRFVDTHTHPYLEEFADPCAQIDAAVAAHVEMCVLPNVDRNTVAPLLDLHRLRPDNTRIAIGLHPTEVNDDASADQIAFVNELLDGGLQVSAIGEIGMDLYWDKSHCGRQMEVLELQLAIASARELPAIIHCREALDETLEVIDGLDVVPQIVFHSFGGSEADVDRIRKVCDPMFGINGIVTFKNCNVREVLPCIGLQRLMLETDAPYLAPVPFRGKLNRPAYLSYVAAHVAESMHVAVEEVAEATTENACRFFSLPKWWT